MKGGGRFRRGGGRPEQEPNPAESNESAEAAEAEGRTEAEGRAEAAEAEQRAAEPAEAVESAEAAEGPARSEHQREAPRDGTQSRSGRRRRASAREEAVEEDVELLVSFPLEEPPELVPVMEEARAGLASGAAGEPAPDTSEGFFGSVETPPAEERAAPAAVPERVSGGSGPGRPDPIRFARLHLRTGSLIRARSEYEALAADGLLDLEGTLDLAEVRWRTADSTGAGLAAAAYVAGGGMDALGFLIAAEAAAREERIVDARDFAVRASTMGLQDVEALFAGVPRRMDWPKDMWGLPAPPSQPRHGGQVRVEVVDAEIRAVEPKAAPAEAAQPATEAAPAQAATEAAPAEVAPSVELEGAPDQAEPAVESDVSAAAGHAEAVAIDQAAGPASDISGQVEPEVENAPESPARFEPEWEVPPAPAGQVEREAWVAEVETVEVVLTRESAVAPPGDAVDRAEAAPAEPAPAEPAAAEHIGPHPSEAVPEEAMIEVAAEEEADQAAATAEPEAAAKAQPETRRAAPQPRSEDFATESRPSTMPLSGAPSPDVQEAGPPGVVEPAAALEQEPAPEAELPADEAEPSPLDAEIVAGRNALASGDALIAALHLAVALRISPAAAPSVLEVIGSHDEVALELVRGDALRLLGELAAQPGSLIGDLARTREPADARPGAPADARPGAPTDARPGAPPDHEPDSSGQSPDPDQPLRWE